MAGGWASLGLLPELVAAVEDDFQWYLPTDIQDEAIPLILGGSDVMASAETGSGKTAAFALPILQLCVEQKEKEKQSAAAKGKEKAAVDDDPGGGSSSSSSSWRMSLLDRDRVLALDPNSHGLRLQSRDPSHWAGCRATHGIQLAPSTNSCFSYFVQVLDDGGIVRVGWATADASLQLGTDGEGWGYGSTGKKVHKGDYLSYPAADGAADNVSSSYEKGDIIGCHLRVTASAAITDTKEQEQKSISKEQQTLATLFFSKNGTMFPDAFELNKKNFSTSGDTVLYPAICLKNAECQFYFSSSRDTNDNQQQQDISKLLPNGSVFLAEAPDHIVAINPRAAIMTSASYRPAPAASTKKGTSSQQQSKGKNSSGGPLVIVIEPTRDLAEQTYQVFDDLAQRCVNVCKVHSQLLVGGMKHVKTVTQALEKNQVDILVGTPPIVASYMKKGIIQPHNCRFFVLDEADQLINTSDTVTHIEAIYSRLLPAAEHRATSSKLDRLQVCFFSATLDSTDVRALASKICHQPLWIQLRGGGGGGENGADGTVLPDTVHHCVIRIDPTAFNTTDFIKTDAVHRKGKLDATITLDGLSVDEANSEKVKQLKLQAVLDVIDVFGMEQVLIFCRTNLDCDLMETYLQSKSGPRGLVQKYSCRVLAGMRSMEERQKSLKDFKESEVRILLATDVAARGIDIRELPFVINMTLPDSSETYVHRAGRVGRAERMGLAVSFVATCKERVWFCRKPKKPPCDDTRDFEKGGNCIWYDEPDLFSQVEKLLTANKVNVTTLTYPDLTSLPPDMQSIIETGGYGEFARQEEVDPVLQATMMSLQQRVEDVALTESMLQTEYWTMRRVAAQQRAPAAR